MINDLECICQLHERIEILYVVDGYIAQLLTQDGDRLVVKAKGDTIEVALHRLSFKVRGKTLEEIRALPGISL